jgi:tol-pal system protein YbgF
MWAVLCVVFSGACASISGSQPDPAVQGDIEQMKQRILDLQEKAAMTEVELERLRQQVARLEARPPAAEPGVDPEPVYEPPAPISTWQGSGSREESVMEESDLPLDQPSPGEPEPMAQGLVTGATVSGSGVGDVAATPGSSDTGSVPMAYEPVVPAGQALYDRGYTLYHQGRYLDAEASFQRFLQAYPRTDLSDNAQFWIGESRYARGDLSGALTAFRETLQQHPEGNKVPDALVKEGDCLAGMGDRDGARRSYEEVVRRFPGSAAAVMASERINDLQ